jgi:hypothetical protein
MPRAVCFNGEDQCMLHPGRKGIKSYGLVFARRFGGTCPEGLVEEGIWVDNWLEFQKGKLINKIACYLYTLPYYGLGLIAFL